MTARDDATLAFQLQPQRPDSPPHLPRLLLVGAAGRNVGKTQLACAAIRQLAARGPVIAVKITTTEAAGEPCARAGEGRRACGSLEGEFAILREDGRDPDKDTARMLAAGAAPCYWIRAPRAHLRTALLTLLERLAPDIPIVCESTSLRLEVVPGVFLLAASSTSPGGKPAAVRVWHDADRLVHGERGSVAFDPAGLAFDPSEGRVCLRRSATAIVLVGGRSERMGRDKARLVIDEQVLLQTVLDRLRPHFAELLISARGVEDYAGFGVPVVPDREPGGGPLVGIVSALAAARYDDCFVCAVDNPEVDVDLVARLLRAARTADIVVPRTAAGSEPLFAVYRRSILSVAASLLAAGERRPSALFHCCRTRWVDLEPGAVILNLNTEAELAAHLARRRRFSGGDGR